MTRFLANENASREAVLAARAAGFDVTWMVELQPGADDDVVLSLAQREAGVLITFDKDFGELVFRHGSAGSPGILLLRPRLRSPEIVTAFIVKVLSQPIDWPGHFTVAREGSLASFPCLDDSPPKIRRDHLHARLRYSTRAMSYGFAGGNPGAATKLATSLPSAIDHTRTSPPWLAAARRLDGTWAARA